ncbi:MAG: hypothetical protein KC646_10920 [Candidatus Cloacimonetes bacterium]|nr:hypothetical protein [Candidatus Cloacimonadota bacterium]
MDPSKIKQIEDLIDLAYDHCNCDEPIATDTKKALQSKKKATKTNGRFTKWQKAFINSEIFKRKI